MRTEIEKAQRSRDIGGWVLICSMVLWGLLVVMHIVDYFFSAVPESFTYFNHLFGVLFIGGGLVSRKFGKRVEYLREISEDKFDDPSDAEINVIYLRRIVLTVYFFGTVCTGLLIYQVFPVSEKFLLGDAFLRHHLPGGFVTFAEILLWLFGATFLSIIGDKLAKVTEQDVYNRRTGG